MKRKAALKAQGPADEEPPIEEDEEDDSGSETETVDRRVTVARPKGESADARKARKAAVKAERAVSASIKKSRLQADGVT
jgi:protein LTV1